MYVLKSAYMHLRGKYKSPISSSQYNWLSHTERQMYTEEEETSSGYLSPSSDAGSSSWGSDTSSSWSSDSSSSYDSGSSSSDSGSSTDFGGGDSGGGGASGDW